MSSDPDLTNLLRAGIAAAKSGQREQARELLMQFVEQDEENVMAWLWLGSVMDDPEEREVCLENVLTLDPDNKTARKGLALLHNHEAAAQYPAPTEAQPSPPAPAETTSSPPQDSFSVESASPAQAQKPATSRYKRLPPSGPPEKPSVKPKQETAEDLLDNENLCLYCAAKTHPDDAKCPKCHQKLWLDVPRQKQASTLLKVLIGLQIIIILQYLLSVGSLIYGVIELASSPEFMASELMDSEFIDPAVMIYLPIALFITVLMGVYNVALLIGLFQRWRIVFYLYLLNSILILGMAVAVTFLMGGLCCGAPLFLLGTSQFFMMLNLGDDFTFNKRRLYLRVDQGLKTGHSFMDRGRSYAKRKMWAIAALHFRRATYLLDDNVDAYMALTVAYLGLKKYDLAAKSLAQAKRINPGNPKVDELKAMLVKERDKGTT